MDEANNILVPSSKHEKESCKSCVSLNLGVPYTESEAFINANLVTKTSTNKFLSEAVNQQILTVAGVSIFLAPYIMRINSLYVLTIIFNLVAFHASLIGILAQHKRPKLAMYSGYAAGITSIVAICFVGLSTVF